MIAGLRTKSRTPPTPASPPPAPPPPVAPVERPPETGLGKVLAAVEGLAGDMKAQAQRIGLPLRQGRFKRMDGTFSTFNRVIGSFENNVLV